LSIARAHEQQEEHRSRGGHAKAHGTHKV
jgi:hypothetical protein